MELVKVIREQFQDLILIFGDWERRKHGVFEGGFSGG